MSNTRRTTEFQRYGGKRTRPRDKWRGHARGIRRSPYAADMNAQASGVIEAVLSAFGSQLRGLRTGIRAGNANSRKGS